MKKVHYINIPNSLSKYRKAQGLTQKDVAKVLKLKGSSRVSRWERSLKPPEQVVFAFQLASVYKTVIEALYSDLYKAVKHDVQDREERLKNKKVENIER